jgi:hypothetical protein
VVCVRGRRGVREGSEEWMGAGWSAYHHPPTPGLNQCLMGLGREGWEGLGVHEHLVGVNMGPGVVVEHRESLAASH